MAAVQFCDRVVLEFPPVPLLTHELEIVMTLDMKLYTSSGTSRTDSVGGQYTKHYGIRIIARAVE
jgi:hypothetical protein